MAAKEKEIDIIALEFPENVRTRPGMYIGATDKPDVILREAIDNSIDELMGSVKGTHLDIQLKNGQSGHWYVVADNGRGIPIQLDDIKHITKTEMAVGSLNAGSKFQKGEGDVSTGLNGVGVSCTNALSEEFVICSRVTHLNYDKSIPEVLDAWDRLNRGELFYVLHYRRGIKISESCHTKTKIEDLFGFSWPAGMSTVTAFIPDKDIWASTVADYSKKSLSYVKIVLDKFYNKEAKIVIDGKSVESAFTPFKYEFLKEIRVNTVDRTKSAQFYINFDVDKDMSIQEQSGSINSLIVNRGLHIDWVKRAFGEALKHHYNIQHDFLSYGLKYNVICLTSNMDFSSQTKERCVKIDNLYYDEVGPYLIQQFHKIFADNEQYFTDHVARLNEFADSINKISAIQKVKQVVGTVEGGNRVRSKLPSSVKDAASNDRGKCELFIVEGKSASGTMLKARNPEYHALLELRGVPLNSINLDLDTIMDNPEMNGIVTAIGAGVNEYFRIDSCRYGKIICAADSDADGERINSMILGFIAKKMTFLIESGMVYVALAPLYHQGNTYVYPGEDPTKILDMSKPFKRYKGLGEINTKEAKEFFFDETKRKLIQITPANLSYVFEVLTMSSVRKELMVAEGIVTDKYYTGIL